jgi:hypothetical protein
MRTTIFFSLLLLFPAVLTAQAPYDNRAFWVKTLTQIAHPVLENLSHDKLKQSMPIESKDLKRTNISFTEAIARTYNGIAPWLELGADQTPEGKIRGEYLALARKGLAILADTSASDYCDFSSKKGGQPLVEAAFLAHALLRAPKQLWEPLDSTVKHRLIASLKRSRTIRPYESNWLLFSAMVETFLLEAEDSCRMQPIENALQKHAKWYKGDGTYGDGADYHWDYYNSIVIQPMLVDITRILEKHGITPAIPHATALARAQRYSEVLERMISPEGTYPPLGRSLAYRFGIFQVLSQMALNETLPSTLTLAQVRSALSEVIHRQVSAPGTFDKDGWLTVGFCGHQPDMGEVYISTGSTYLCLMGMLPLGLPVTHPFWTDPSAEWTSKKAWNGINISTDHAIKESRKK